MSGPSSFMHVLTDAGALIDQYLPAMAELLARPHMDNDADWMRLRNEIDADFSDNGWDDDESRIAFDLLVAFAERSSHDSGTP